MISSDTLSLSTRIKTHSSYIAITTESKNFGTQMYRWWAHSFSLWTLL